MIPQSSLIPVSSFKCLPQFLLGPFAKNLTSTGSFLILLALKSSH